MHVVVAVVVRSGLLFRSGLFDAVTGVIALAKIDPLNLLKKSLE